MHRAATVSYTHLNGFGQVRVVEGGINFYKSQHFRDFEKELQVIPAEIPGCPLDMGKGRS